MDCLKLQVVVKDLNLIPNGNHVNCILKQMIVQVRRKKRKEWKDEVNLFPNGNHVNCIRKQLLAIIVDSQDRRRKRKGWKEEGTNK